MKKKLLLIVFLCITHTFYAQEINFGKIPYTKVKVSQQKSTPVAILFNDLQPTSGTEFRLVKTQKDASNKTHQTYQQYYNGVKVELGILKVHQENGLTIAYNGAYFNTSTIRTSASVRKSQIASNAKQFMGTDDVFWFSGNEIATTTIPEPELVILPNRTTQKLSLTYALNIGASSPELRMGTIYLDAQSGTVLKYKNRLFTCFDVNNDEGTHSEENHKHTSPFANGTAATAYSGSQSFETVLESSTYILNDETRATGSNWILSAQGLGTKTGIFTVDIRNSTSLTNTFYEFEDANNNWTAAEMSSNEDQYALDVHWGSQIVYDYWANVRGRSSYNGSNSALMSIVHYGNNYTNAAWGAVSDDLGYMIYGDGAGSYTPLTTLDVVSHEIGHGITNATASLDYELESGAINEGLSDIWAIVVENYANTNHGTSKDISVLNEENGGGAIRSMSNPNAYGQPDTYGGTFWYDVAGCTPNANTNDYCGVHTNSGVLNYWFWLLSQGGSGTNDLGNSFSVSAVGMDDAAAIVWHMQNNYLTATSDYADARTAAIQAAVDLYGTCSNQEQAVTNAFYAVGVGSAFQTILPSITTQPSGSTIAVNETGQVSITAQDYDAIQWQYSDDNGGTWYDANGDTIHSGDTTTTLSMTFPFDYTQGFQYRAIVTNNCGSVTSNVATVYIFEYTAIPDTNFETALDNLGYDDISGDGQVPTHLIETISDLDVQNSNISDLTGIEDFRDLETLVINNNSISTLDMSNNLNLLTLNVRNNVLTSLNVSSCLDLDALLIQNNNLSSIDVSNNTELTRFWAENNSFNILDVTNNPLLTGIGVQNSNLTSLDLSNNTALEQLYANYNAITTLDLSNNPSLRIVSLSGNNLASFTIKNGGNTTITSFSVTNNPNLTCILVDDAAYSTANWTNVDAQVNFNDVVCYDNYTNIPDANFEAALEALGYDDISGDGQVPTHLIETITDLDVQNSNISDLTGIEDFRDLEILTARDNTITTIDVSNNINLTSLVLRNNTLSAIDVSANTALEILNVINNDISSIDIANNTALLEIYVQDNNLTSLDVSVNTNVTILAIARNPITSIDLSTNTQLTGLFATGCDIVDIDFSNNPNIDTIGLVENNLESCNMQNGNNTIVNIFNITNNPNLTCILVDDAAYSNANWTNVDAQVNFNDVVCYDNYTNIPDANFEAALEALGYDDISGDGQVPTALIEVVTSLDVNNQSISDLTGIEDFTALTFLNVTNNSLTSIDVTNNVNLETLLISTNPITAVDLSTLTNLTRFNARYSDLATIDLTNNILLEDMNIEGNANVASLDVSNNTLLKTLDASDCAITSVDITMLTNLDGIDFGNNQLTSIDVSNNVLATFLYLSNNQLSSDLDLSGFTLLEELELINCNLTGLNLRNGNNTLLDYLDITNNPNLTCVFVDDVSYATTNFTEIDAGTTFTDTDYCEYTQIPDSNFEAALGVLGYDDISSDGQVPTALIETVTSLDVESENIILLTGIEDFTALEILQCSTNVLGSLDLSNNTALREVYCTQNKLFNLEFGVNTVLTILECDDNDLDSIDLSGVTALETIQISDTRLTTIDFTNNTALKTILATEIEVTDVDLSMLPNLEEIAFSGSDIANFDLRNGNNTNISTFSVENVPALTCIFVDDANYATTNWTTVDPQVHFTDSYCDYTQIPDSNFEAALEALGYDDISNDGQVPTALIEVVTFLDIQNENISDLTGIEDFIALQILYFTNNSVTTVDVSNLPVLRSVRGINNGLTAFDITNNPLMDDLRIEDNNITTLDLSNNPLLEILQLDENQLTALDLSNNPLITRLRVGNNNITTLDLSNNTALSEVQLQVNELVSLNIQNGNNTNISTFQAFNNPNLTCIRVDDASYSTTNWTAIDAASSFSDTFCNYTSIPDLAFEAALHNLGYDDIVADGQVPTALIENVVTLLVSNQGISDLTGIEDFASLGGLNCSGNNLTNLDVSALPLLIELNADVNNLTAIDVSSNTALQRLEIKTNPITEINLAQSVNLKELDLQGTSISIIDLSNNLLLEEFRIAGTSITLLNLSNNTLLTEVVIDECDSLLSVNLKNGTNTALTTVDITDNANLSCILVDDATYSMTNWTNTTGTFTYAETACFANYTTIPDIQFETLLDGLGYDDISGDGQVPTSLISGIVNLDLSTSGIADITGIQDFSSLEILNISDNSFTTLDLGGNSSIKELYAEGVNADVFDASNMTALEILYAFESGILAIDLTNCTALEELRIYSSSISSLDVSTNTALKKLYAYEQNILSVNLNGATALEEIYVYRTGITDLDISTNTALRIVECYEGDLDTINTNGAIALEELYIQRSDVIDIDVSSNTALTTLHCYQQPLATLNTTGAIALQELQAYTNALETLDLSTNIALETIDVSDTNLNTLNIQNGTNTAITTFDATSNANLYCILVDDTAYSTTNWTNIDAQANFNETTCDYVVVDIDVFLQGALINPEVGEENLMRDDLRYDGALYGETSPYSDGVSIPGSVAYANQGADSMVDWVWVELRDASDFSTAIAGQSAVLQRDGDVVSTTDGTTPLFFDTIPAGDYYIVVKHRNHLGIMTANTISLSKTATTVDFTDATNEITFGSNAQTNFGMPTDIMAMWCGNVNGDIVLQYSGTNPDTPDILSEVLNDAGNFLNFPTYSVNDYSESDVDMDGNTQYSGTNPDTPFILQNILAHPGNILGFSTFQILEQLPENIL